MAYYFIAQIKINDYKEYKTYLDRVDEIFSKFNGKYLALDKSPQVIEGSRNYTRSVMIEFPAKCDFEKWYYSDEYQEILKHRIKGAECDSILIKGKL